MGLFKQIKQMKESVSEAPELVRSAMEMQEAMRAQAQPAASPASGSADGSGSAALDDETISNVSLARYAQICRTGTERGVTDVAGVAAVAVEHGVSPTDWDAAVSGWNARFASDTATAMRFNALWRGIA